MDNVTHALAGALLAAGTVSLVASRRGASGYDATSRRSRAFRRVAFVSGVVAAELPDSDLLYAGDVLGMGKLGYMLHHRGHTHTVVFAVLGALVIWLVGWWFVRRAREAAPLDGDTSVERNALFALALVGTLSHLVLDYTNSYGVHPFWPVDNRWYYGDAVFIVEPWLWIASIPPLVLFARSKGWRAVLLVLLLGILVAAWRVDMVGRTMAAVLTAGAALWFALVRIVPADRRLTFALVAWLSVEGTFFAASARAREIVRQSVGAPYVDAALTPAVSNPFCVRAIVVTEREGFFYAVTRATVAPFPNTVPVARCAAAEGIPASAGGGGVHRPSTAAIRWGGGWSGPPLGDLIARARSDCEFGAALRFIRIPVWTPESDRHATIADYRFGEGARGFAGLTTTPGAPCPRFIPPWIPPRADLLGGRTTTMPID